MTALLSILERMTATIGMLYLHCIHYLAPALCFQPYFAAPYAHGRPGGSVQPLRGVGRPRAAIEKTAWLTDQKIELAEEEKALLDDKLRLLLGTGRAGAFNWFLRDERKDSGAYVTAVGIEKIRPAGAAGRPHRSDGYPH